MDENSIVLIGENKAGHARKVEFIEFAGRIDVDAGKVDIVAESWMEKQMRQAARFKEKKKTKEMSEQKGFRFY